MSESTDMYLITLARLGKNLGKPVPISSLAEELSVKVVSANQMIRKLDEEGLVSYQPYKGVLLTETGENEANQILYHRQLWEKFFTTHLKMDNTEADALACRVEHLTSITVAEKLFDFLKNPLDVEEVESDKTNIQGKFSYTSCQLSDLPVGQISEILRLEMDDTSKDFFTTNQLLPGKSIQITGKSSNGNILVKTENQTLVLSQEYSEKITVNKGNSFDA